MKEYKIIESYSRTSLTEEALNELAGEGWQVVGLTEYQIMLERERSEDEESEEEKHLLHD